MLGGVGAVGAVGRVGRVGAATLSKGGADDLAAFLAWAAQFRDDTGIDANGQQIHGLAGISGRIIMPATPGGSMWGSPWGTWYTNDSSRARVAQHLFEDVSALNANLGKVVVLSGGENYGSHASYSVDRNGYASGSYGAFSCYYKATLDYLDPRHPGKRVRMDGWSQNKLLFDL